ncbi:MAG: hypothetical protein JNK82_45325 [Myxococcaceae bacterium]|nr:hypothetical protein [Myxococcaceae bacterium]
MASRRSVLVLLLAGCIYGAPRATARDDECRRICADTYATCVREGVGRQLGLPGVTHDVCSREQDGCVERCRPSSGAVARSKASSEVSTPPLAWDGATLRCAGGVLSLPAAWEVKAASDAEAQLSATDAVAVVQAGRGEPAPLFEVWAKLHARLSPDGGAPSFTAEATFVPGSGWAFDYAAADGGVERFHAEERTVRRGGGYCRVLAVERVGPMPQVKPLLDALRD